jgi:hypothetical protein
MRFSRRNWIAAACTMAVLLGTSSAQAQQTKILPNDSEMIVTINLQQILKSEVLKSNKLLLDLVKAKLTDELDNKGIGKYFKKADFDLFRDLTSVTMSFPGGRNPEEGFILLEGKFDLDKIEAAAVDAAEDAGGGLKVTRIANIKAFEVAPEGEKTIYIGVLDKKTMIAAATKADFADAVARFKGTKDSSLKTEVKDLLKTVNSKQSINAIATSNILAKLSEKAPQGNNEQAKMAVAALNKLEGVSLAITVQKDIDFQVGVNTKDKETAESFATLGTVAIAGLKMSLADKAKNNEDLLPAVDVLKTLRATAKGTNLIIQGQISFETLTTLLKKLPINN